MTEIPENEEVRAEEDKRNQERLLNYLAGSDATEEIIRI